MGMLLLNGSNDFGVRQELFSNNEQGLWLDPSDMTAGKAGWRRNLLTYSEQLDNSVWSKDLSSISANASTSPDGTTTADKLIPDNTSGVHRLRLSVLSTTSFSYTVSFYAKASEISKICFREGNTTGAYAAFDLSNGTIIHQGQGGTGAVISVGSGWYRCSVSFTAGASARIDIIALPNSYTSSNSPIENFTFNGTDGFFLWGIQYEQSSTPTDYQPITDFSTEFKAAYPTHTLYQDSSGVTPCTAAGDPVGLILDQSRGGLGALGPELVTNGGFDADTNWTKGTGWTITGGLAVATSAAAFSALSQNLSFGASKFIKIRVTATINSGTVYVQPSSGAAPATIRFLSAGVNDFILITGASGSNFQFLAGGGGFDGTIDNISVREVPGNHAYQTTSGARPTLARIPSSGRRNLLTRTEEFDNAAWTKDNSATVTANSTTAPDGTATADTITAGTTGTFRQVRQLFALSSGNQRTFTCYLKAGATNVAYLLASDMVAHADGRYFDLANGTLGGQTGLTVGSTVTLNDSSIESVGSGWYRCRITVTVSASTTFSFLIGIADANNSVTSTANKTILAWGAQLETGSTATNYQKVGSTHDVTESGFNDLWFLSFDGSDDSLVTNAVDFTATDEMTVIAGVRKLSDAADGNLLELTANTNANTGSFYIWAPEVGVAAYASLGRGTQAASINQRAQMATGTAPDTAVLTVSHDISDDLSSIRRNGVAGTAATGEKGSGNFANAALYIGRRGGSSQPYNGHIYQLIVRGKTTPTGKLLEAERFVAKRTGVTGI